MFYFVIIWLVKERETMTTWGFTYLASAWLVPGLTRTGVAILIIETCRDMDTTLLAFKPSIPSSIYSSPHHKQVAIGKVK
jgi:hypothetical protein